MGPNLGKTLYPRALGGTLALQPGPRFQQIGDGDGGESPILDKSGTGTGERPRPRANRGRTPRPRSPDKSESGTGTGTGTGPGVSAPWPQGSLGYLNFLIRAGLCRFP
jgi:hypothetical protein